MWLLLPQIAVRLQDYIVKRKKHSFSLPSSISPHNYLCLAVPWVKYHASETLDETGSYKCGITEMCWRSLSSTISTVEVLDFKLDFTNCIISNLLYK